MKKEFDPDVMLQGVLVEADLLSEVFEGSYELLEVLGMDESGGAVGPQYREVFTKQD